MKMTKEALIEALEAQRPVIVARDAAVLKAHRAKNKEVAKARRTVLREIANWPDDKLAEWGEGFIRYLPGRTICPVALLPGFEWHLKMLQHDSRKTITINETDSDYAYQLLTVTVDGPQNATVC